MSDKQTRAGRVLQRLGGPIIEKLNFAPWEWGGEHSGWLNSSPPDEENIVTARWSRPIPYDAELTVVPVDYSLSHSPGEDKMVGLSISLWVGGVEQVKLNPERLSFATVLVAPNESWELVVRESAQACFRIDVYINPERDWPPS